MRVLIVAQYFWPENFRINDVARGLAERGHEVTVYTGKPNYPDGRSSPRTGTSAGPEKTGTESGGFVLASRRR